jgi:hypothetical protein
MTGQLANPQLIAKHQRRWDGFDETILALYARGMTTRDIMIRGQSNNVSPRLRQRGPDGICLLIHRI